MLILAAFPVHEYRKVISPLLNHCKTLFIYVAFHCSKTIFNRNLNIEYLLKHNSIFVIRYNRCSTNIRKACLCLLTNSIQGRLVKLRLSLFSLQIDRTISRYLLSVIFGTIKCLSASYSAGAKLLQSAARTMPFPASSFLKCLIILFLVPQLKINTFILHTPTDDNIKSYMKASSIPH